MLSSCALQSKLKQASSAQNHIALRIVTSHCLLCLVHCFGKFLTEASVKYSLERTAEQSSQNFKKNLSTLTARGDTPAIIAVNLLLRLTASMFQSRQMKRCTESKVETFFTPLTTLYSAAAVLIDPKKEGVKLHESKS